MESTAKQGVDGRRVRTLRVLVVEDDADQRLGIRDVLLMEGFQVDTAGDGTLGAVMLASGGYDFLISDIRLPGMSGIELARRAGATAVPPLVILITAYPEWHEQAQAQKPGILVLRKPISLRLLGKVLEDFGSSRERSRGAGGSE